MAVENGAIRPMYSAEKPKMRHLNPQRNFVYVCAHSRFLDRTVYLTASSQHDVWRVICRHGNLNDLGLSY